MKSREVALGIVAPAAAAYWVLGGWSVFAPFGLAERIGWDVVFDLEFLVEALASAIPAAAVLFVWFRHRRPGDGTAALWAAGVIAFLVLGSATGIMLGRAGADVVLQEVYYVVSHFHYVARIAATFMLFAGFYFWFPRITGWRVSALLGRLHFAATFLGVSIAFFPKNYMPLASAPRRMAEFDAVNNVSTVGAVIALLGTVFFVAALVEALLRRRAVVPDLR